MEFFELIGAVAVIVEESIKLLPRNGKFMALIAILSLMLFSALFFEFNFFCRALSNDMIAKEFSFIPSASDSNMPDFTMVLAGIVKDFQLLLVIFVSYLLAIFFISLLTTIATIVVSAMSYTNKTLSFKNLLLQVVKSFVRTFVTAFYTTLLAVGYSCIVLVMASPLLMLSGTFRLTIAIMLAVAAQILYLYLTVVWVLALVISVIEENNYGIQALGKAVGLVKGMKLHGFILNIFFTLPSWILFLGFWILGAEKWMANQTVLWLFLTSCARLMNMFQLMAYTVFYFHCKRCHGEEIELQGTVSYEKLSTVPAF